MTEPAGGDTSGHDHGDYDVDPTHHHPPQPDLEDSAFVRHQVMQIAVTSLLVEKGIFSADDMRAQVERMDALNPGTGARLVARAWVDDAFRKRLLADSGAAAAELGVDIGPIPILVMENTPRTSQSDRVHAVLLLPEIPARPSTRLVQVAKLPPAGSTRAAPGPGGVRNRA